MRPATHPRTNLVPALLLLLLTVATPAGAHAVLTDDALSGSFRLDPGEATLELDLSQPIDARLADVHLEGSDGSVIPVKLEVPILDPRTLLVHTPPLAEDGYRLAWRVVGLDGHASEGTLVFATGAASAPEADADGPTRPSWIEGASRALLALGLMTCAGLRIVARRALKVPLPVARERRARSAGAVAALVGASGVLWAYLDAAQAPLTTAVSAFPGAVRAAQVLLAVGLLVLVLRDRTSAGLLAGISLAIHVGTGHALVHEGPHAAHFHLVGLALHVGAATFWSSGVLALALSTWTGPAALARAIRRFTPMALASVALLGVTGLYAAWASLASWTELTGSLWGRVLLAKTALVLAAGAVGAFHAIARDRVAPRATRSLRVEVALLVVTVGTAALLGAIPLPNA